MRHTCAHTICCVQAVAREQSAATSTLFDPWFDSKHELESKKPKTVHPASDNEHEPATKKPKTHHSASDVLRAATQHTYENFYRHQYNVLNLSVADQGKLPAAFFMDVGVPPVFGVHRPNHGLANALRKAALVRPVTKACSLSLDETLLQVMEVAMLFEKCSRESDIGFNDDQKAFLRYQQASYEAFDKYAQEMKLDTDARQKCKDALERMYRSPKTSESKHIKRVFELCHDLDLYRCLGGDRMVEKLEKIKQKVGPAAGDKLARQAIEWIVATGDRLMFSPFPDLVPRDYQSIFAQCSEPEGCMRALGLLPVTGTQSASAAYVPAPSPKIPGEHPTRFSDSKFKRLHTA